MESADDMERWKQPDLFHQKGCNSESCISYMDSLDTILEETTNILPLDQAIQTFQFGPVRKFLLVESHLLCQL